MTLSPSLTLFTSYWRAGLCVAPDLTPVTYACSTGIFIPLFTMLVYLAGHGARSGRALRATFSRDSDYGFILVTKQRLTLSCEALGGPVSTHAFGTPTHWPVLPILKHMASIGTWLSRAHTDGAAASFRDEFQLLVATQQRWAWLGAASDFPMSAGAHTTRGGGPLCPMRMDFLLMMARSRSRCHTLRAALVGSYLKHVSLLKSTLRVSANSGFADHNITMTTATLA